jgi:hypothetical protein
MMAGHMREYLNVVVVALVKELEPITYDDLLTEVGDRKKAEPKKYLSVGCWRGKDHFRHSKSLLEAIEECIKLGKIYEDENGELWTCKGH